MTAQWPDLFVLNGAEFWVAGVNGAGLFDPRSVGLFPAGLCTACYRRYVCHYSIKDDRLVLQKLRVSLGTDHIDSAPFYRTRAGPEINGVKPTVPSDRFEFLNNVYEGLDLRVDLTGGMVIGRDFINELYVHMGFHPPWKFRTAFELMFNSGKVLEVRDVSERMGEIRRDLAVRLHGPDPESAWKEIFTEIESAFKLDYCL